MTETLKPFDPKEFDLPETHFVRDIENRVFQGIVLQVLASINDITLIEGSFIDNFLGRDNLEGIRGVHIEQDSKKQCVSVKLDINIRYGIAIPDKADEIQAKVAEEITRLTGLHVSSVHVIFKNMVLDQHMTPISELLTHTPPVMPTQAAEDDYSDEF